MKWLFAMLLMVAVFPAQAQLHISDSVTAYHTDTAGDFTLVHLPPYVFVEKTMYYSSEEYRQFWRTRFFVTRAMPYAREALRQMEETEAEMAGLKKKRHQKKYIRQAYDNLKEQYKDPLKQMYVEEGRVLIKIIERETGRTMYDIIKQYKGADDAIFWQGVAKLNGYSLKEGYDPEKEPILERILSAMEEPLD